MTTIDPMAVVAFIFVIGFGFFLYLTTKAAVRIGVAFSGTAATVIALSVVAYLFLG